jgi:hypothetical protein
VAYVGKTTGSREVGERGRNRTYNLLIKSSGVWKSLPRFSTFKNQ